MPTRVTPDTRSSITIDFDDNGVIIAATENGVATTIDRGLEVWIENQNKNIALSRLIAAGLYNPETDPTPWEIKNGKVNIKVRSRDATKAKSLLTGLAVSVNG